MSLGTDQWRWIRSDGTGWKTISCWVPANSGGLTLVERIVASNDTNVEFTGIDDSHESYFVEIQAAKPASNDVSMIFEFGTGDPTITWHTTGYAQAAHTLQSNLVGNFNSNVSTSRSGLEIIGFPSGQNRLGNSTGEGGDATLSFNRVVGSAQRPRFRFTGWYTDADNDMNYIDGAGQLPSTTDLVTALRFKMSSGNIDSGVFCLYGRAKS